MKTNADAIASTRPVGVRNYLAEHSIGSVLRCAMEIFAAHFRTIFLVSFLPTFPLATLQQEAMEAGNTAFFILVPELWASS